MPNAAASTNRAILVLSRFVELLACCARQAMLAGELQGLGGTSRGGRFINWSSVAPVPARPAIESTLEVPSLDDAAPLRGIGLQRRSSQVCRRTNGRDGPDRSS